MTSPLAPASRPLVVAVEGRCFAGKTTLCHALAAQLDGTAVIPEYADLAPLPPFPPRTPADVTAALQHLLIVERRRTRLWRPDARLALCDRSPLTLITYEHGMAALGLPAAPAEAASLFADAADRGDILIPDAYIHLTLDQATTRQRQRRRGRVRPHLTHPRMGGATDVAYNRYLTQLPSARVLFLNGATAPSSLLERAAAFLTSRAAALVDTPAPPTWRGAAEAPQPPAVTVARGHR